MSERHSGSGASRSRSGASGTPPIVIASKDANQRHANSAGNADPGPGDMEAAPSEMPQPVEIPEPPTASQLVVKSSSVPGSSRGLSGMQTNQSQFPTRSNMELVSGSASGPAASQPSMQAAREPTSSRPLTGPGPYSAPREGSSVASAASGSHKSGASSAAATSAAGGGGAGSAATLIESGAAEPSSPGAASANSMGGSPATASSPDGRSHHEDEVGEGEVEHDGQESSPATSPASGTGQQHQQSRINSSPAVASSSRPKSTSSKLLASATGNNSTIMSPQALQAFKQGQSAGASSSSSKLSTKPAQDKKVTRFRYHKRITVRTSGKNNPQAIMSKVNKGVSPSTIGEIDASDLMKRVGIKNTKHWRIRVRQTKRITKNGKTTTQTKTAYRDSSGNLQPPPGTCKKCAKKQSECKCPPASGSSTGGGGGSTK